LAFSRLQNVSKTPEDLRGLVKTPADEIES